MFLFLKRSISEKEYLSRMKQIQRENKYKERIANLKKEQKKYKKPIRFPSTSKLILLAVVLINIQIIWFVEKAMMQWGDFSAAYALIGIPATLIPIIWGYYSKSKAENTSGGIVYDMAMAQAQMEPDNETIEQQSSEGEVENNNAKG